MCVATTEWTNCNNTPHGIYKTVMIPSRIENRQLSSPSHLRAIPLLQPKSFTKPRSANQNGFKIPIRSKSPSNNTTDCKRRKREPHYVSTGTTSTNSDTKMLLKSSKIGRYVNRGISESVATHVWGRDEGPRACEARPAKDK